MHHLIPRGLQIDSSDIDGGARFCHLTAQIRRKCSVFLICIVTVFFNAFSPKMGGLSLFFACERVGKEWIQKCHSFHTLFCIVRIRKSGKGVNIELSLFPHLPFFWSRSDISWKTKLNRVGLNLFYCEYGVFVGENLKKSQFFSTFPQKYVQFFMCLIRKYQSCSTKLHTQRVGIWIQWREEEGWILTI